MFAAKRTDWSSLKLDPLPETEQRIQQRRRGRLDLPTRTLADRIYASSDSDIDPRRAPSLRPDPGSALARAASGLR